MARKWWVWGTLWLAGCSASGDDVVTPTPDPGPSGLQENQSSYAGDYALDYLRSEEFTSIHIEIDYMEDPDPSDDVDNAPSEVVIGNLITMLEELCDKPGGVTYDPQEGDVMTVETEIDGSDKVDYTYDDINDLEVFYRDHYRKGDEAILYFAYVNGFYVTDEGDSTSVIGFAHHGSSMAVFKGMVNASIPAARDFYEDVVVRHEVGHLLGLVDVGIDPVDESHVDPAPQAAGAHCSNTKCLMYWQVASRDFLASVLGDPLDLDQDCRDDITAAGGKMTTERRLPIDTSAVVNSGTKRSEGP